MPKTEKVYPEWVQNYRKKGTTVKKKGDAYYLYCIFRSGKTYCTEFQNTPSGV